MVTALRLWIALVSAVVLPALATGQTETHRIGLLTWYPCDVPTYLQGNGEFGPFIRGLVRYGYKPSNEPICCHGARVGIHGCDLVVKPITVSGRYFDFATNACSSATTCILDQFAAVPRGSQLIITQVSCIITSTGTSKLALGLCESTISFQPSWTMRPAVGSIR